MSRTLAPLLLAFALPTLAQDAGPAPDEGAPPVESGAESETPPAPEPVAPTPKPEPKPKIVIPKLLVLDLVDEGAGPEITSAVSEAVAAQALRSYQGQLITQAQIRVALDAAAVQALAGCDTAECITDVANKMSATRALGGAVKKTEAGLEITLTLVDPENAKLLRETTRTSPPERDLYFYTAQQLTSYILTGKASDTRVPVRVESEPKGAQVFVDEKPAGETPVDLKLDPGDHEIVLVYPDHLDFKKRLTVQDGTPDLLRAELVRKRGSLWPAAIVTGVLGVGALGTGFVFNDLADFHYQGSSLFFGEANPEAYLVANPTSDLALSQKRREVQSAELTAIVLLSTGAALTSAGLVLGVAELFLGE